MAEARRSLAENAPGDFFELLHGGGFLFGEEGGVTPQA